MASILVISPIDPGALAQLRSRHDVTTLPDATDEELRSHIGQAKIVVFRSGVDLTADVMAAAPRLRLLVRAGSGTDNLDLDYVARRGLRLERVPEPGARAVAELTFGLMLALARRIREADALLRQGRWAKNEMPGHLLAGKTLGIVGVGNVGRVVAERGAAWGMHPVGCVEPGATLDEARAEPSVRLTGFDEVLAAADYLSLHVPLSPSTHHLVDAAAMAKMKPGAFLVNTARGGVVDEQALYTALTTGRLAGAALDVHEAEGEGCVSPLAALDNVLLTPHIGATTVETQQEIGRRVLQIVNDFEEEGYDH